VLMESQPSPLDTVCYVICFDIKVVILPQIDYQTNENL
jgi:hypothetical protein